jgi:hypothetical protein
MNARSRKNGSQGCARAYNLKMLKTAKSLAVFSKV